MKETELYTKIVRFKTIYELISIYFFIGVISLHSFIKNVFIKIKNSIFPPNYTRYKSNVREQKSKILLILIDFNIRVVN